MYYPDVPECISVEKDLQETPEYTKEALELHVYGMLQDIVPLPTPSSTSSNDVTEGNLVLSVTVYPELVKAKLDNRKVKTNCNLPSWLKDLSEQQ